MNKRTIVISGGSSGIGYALTKLFAQEGSIVYSLDKDIPKDKIEGVNYLQVDLSDSKQVMDSLVNIKQPVNVVVSGAGMMKRGTVFDTTEEEYDLLMNNNVKTSWLLLKHIRPLLATNPCIVQISSGHAIDLVADPGIYALTKRTTEALAEIVSLTIHDARVKIVYPGPVLTPLLLTGRTDEDKVRISKIAIKPDELAPMVSKLIDSDNKYLRYDNDNNKYEFKK